MNRLVLPLCALLLGFAVGALWFQSTQSPPRNAEPPLRTPATIGDGQSVDPLAAAIATFEHLGAESSLDQFVRIGAQLESLDSAQLTALLDYLETHLQNSLDRRVGAVIEWWLKRDPAAASAWMQPRLLRWAQDGPLGSSFGYGVSSAAEVWARGSPEEALKFARQHPRSGLAVLLLEAALHNWPEKDAAKRYALLHEFPEGRARTTQLLSNFEAWTAQDPTGAIVAAKTLPAGIDRNDAIAAVLRSWAAKDATSALEQYRSTGFSDFKTLGTILKSLGQSDPRKAVAQLDGLDAQQTTRMAHSIVQGWAQSDPAAAFTWALQNGVSISNAMQTTETAKFEHDAFGRNARYSGVMNVTAPFALAMIKDPKATVAWINSLPPGPDRDRYSEHAVSMVSATSDLKKALFNKLAPDAQERTTTSILWSIENIDAARTWVESISSDKVRRAAWYRLGQKATAPFDMPPGPDRDAMLHGRITGFGARIPEESFKLNVQISDPVVRRDAFDAAMEHFNHPAVHQGDEARAWMEKADLPDEWKRRWRVPTPSPSSKP
jgi:hypothetical protein